MSSAGSEVLDAGEKIDQASTAQGEPLLRTKLFAPPVRPNRVRRPRLLERINSGLDKALILISAPAGYGKTTLASTWLQETKTPYTWLSLDEGDNDPIRFQQNFTAALQKIFPTIQSDPLSVLQGIQPGLNDALLHLLINQVAEYATPFAFVLDDFHLIHAQSVLEKLAYLIERKPPQMHLLLLSRTDPPLPLSRLHARDQLVEIRAEQLRFTQDEIAAFLNQVMGLRLSGEDISAMEARTEGWIAGLQLAALSMRGCNDIPAFVSAFTGSHYYIMDYLTEEVLKLQPQSVRSFLLHTSILTSMCASLCDALIDQEGTAPSNGQQTLEALEQMNLFVIPLDNKRQWYRYHHLFADVLNLRLERLFPQQLPDLHRRASLWYEQNGIIPEAIQHALLAKDQARAAQLVEQHGCSLLMRGEGFTLLKWAEAVEPYLRTHPWLMILKAWALALTGQLDPIESNLQSAEGLISPLERTTEVKIMVGSIAAVRAYLANLRGETRLATEYALAALEDLPESNAFSCSLRGVTISILGDSSWMDGNLEAARQAYLEAVRTSQGADNMYITMIAHANMADVLMDQGQLHQAARLYADTLHIATRPDGQKLPLADRLYAGLAKIFYQWNQLEAAAEYLQPSIELCQQWGNFNLLAQIYALLARLDLAKSDPQNAYEAVRAAELLNSEQRLSLRRSAWLKCAIARWWLVQGRLEPAANLVQQLGLTTRGEIHGDEIPYSQETEYLLQLRLLLSQGDGEAALSLSRRLLRLAQATQRTGRLIELLVLQSLAHQVKKDTPQALAVLDQALSLARSEGYVRVFLDEGEPMTKLLHQARSHHLGSGYASELLSALGGVTSAGLPPAQPLIEPLTLRELEVLKRIAAGDSNLDIANELVISLPTVKRHISNIYAKLGVKSRTQAVSMAKELELFE